MPSFESSSGNPRTNGQLGIPAIDIEHQELHLIVRELAVFPHEPITSLWSQRLLGEIWRHSFDHFRHEERLMAERGLPPDELGRHAADHMLCLNYVTRLWAQYQYPYRQKAPTSGEVYDELVEYWRRHIALYDAVIPEHADRETFG